MQPHVFSDLPEVTAWVAKHGDAGLRAIKEAAYNPHSPSSDAQRDLLRGWVDMQRDDDADGLAKQALELNRRNVEATELSARAAEKSALAAIKSVRWAAAAFAISFAALLVSYFKQ